VADTVMHDEGDKIALAKTILAAARGGR